MSFFIISFQDGDEPLRRATMTSHKAEVQAFLLRSEASRYSVSEWDSSSDDAECIERLNGEEWLNQNSDPQPAIFDH